MQVSRLTIETNKKTNKKYIKEHKMNPCGTWQYIEVWWSETIGLCKKLNIIYNIINCNPEPQANSLEERPVYKLIFLLNRFFLVNYLKRLRQFAARAAQLLNQNSLSDAWHSLGFKMNQNSSVSDPVLMNHPALQFLLQSLNWVHSSTRTTDRWAADMSMGEHNTLFTSYALVM